MGDNKLTKDLCAKRKKLGHFLSSPEGMCGSKTLDPIRDPWKHRANTIGMWLLDATVSRLIVGQKGVTRGITHKATGDRYMATTASRMGDQRSEVEAYCASKRNL